MRLLQIIVLSLLALMLSMGHTAAKPASPPRGVLLTLNIATGKILTQVPVPQVFNAVVPYGTDGTHIILDTTKGMIVVVDPYGRVHARIAVCEQPAALVADRKLRRAFVVCQAGGARVRTVDPETGTVVATDSVPPQSQLYLATAQQRVLVVGLHRQHASAVLLDARTGHRLATKDLGPSTGGQALSSTLTAIDTATGKVITVLPVPGSPTSLVLDVARRRLFIHDNAGITVVDTGRLTIMRTLPLGGIVSDPVESSQGQLIALSQGPEINGGVAFGGPGATVDIVDVATAKVLRRVPVAPAPDEVAFDAMGERAVVVSLGPGGFQGQGPATITVLDLPKARVRWRRTLALPATIIDLNPAGSFSVLTT